MKLQRAKQQSVPPHMRSSILYRLSVALAATPLSVYERI